MVDRLHRVQARGLQDKSKVIREKLDGMPDQAWCSWSMRTVYIELFVRAGGKE